jgi:hypothetical protein
MAKKLNKSLQDQLNNICIRLWMLENPQKFNKGDEVEYHMRKGFEIETGVVVNIEYCDKYLGPHWIYTIWNENQKEINKYYDWDEEYLNHSDRGGWIRLKEKK